MNVGGMVYPRSLAPTTLTLTTYTSTGAKIVTGITTFSAVAPNTLTLAFKSGVMNYYLSTAAISLIITLTNPFTYGDHILIQMPTGVYSSTTGTVACTQA